MRSAKIGGIGFYVPENVVKNDDLAEVMETSDQWIQERTGIKERRFADRLKENTTTMGTIAAERAIADAGIEKEEVDFIIFATLAPDYFFPGCGVLLQRELGITKTEIGALDIRNQCSGFIYGLSVADQFVKSGMYKNILLVGAEKHSMGLDFSTKGRGVSVIFGDGAGAVVIQPTEEEGKGILTTKLHSNGTYAEKLSLTSPAAHSGVFAESYEEGKDYGFDESVKYGELLVTDKMVKDGYIYPHMEGQFVFKLAVQKFPEVILEALNEVGLKNMDIDMFIPHQANLRISQFVQRLMGLPDEKVWNNITKYGNTTAASIPIALAEAYQAGAVKSGDLVCLAAFGSGFTWGSALIRW